MWQVLTGVPMMVAMALLGQQTASVPFRTLDLDIGQQQECRLTDGRQVTIKLIELRETRDEVRSAVRAASALVEIDGQRIQVECSMYHLPISVAGLQIDCPVTKSFLRDSAGNSWGLVKDARFRLWPAGSSFLDRGTFAYPVKQRWFASDTQMANEPVFVDRGECPSAKKIYYHSGLDFGGVEGVVEVVAAADALVVCAGDDMLAGYEQQPVSPRYDAIYLLDARNWYYRYSHLKQINPSIRPGQRVRMGETIGLIGKEGGSGGWSHLHFAIWSLHPSGEWGIQEAYAFVWEAYQSQYKPELLAVARPHQLAWSGDAVTLDGRRSWSAAGKITRYAWTFTDGTTASGPVVKKTYEKPGTFSEILEVRDMEGRVSYDFTVVQVMDKEHPDWCIPTIHAVCSPTAGICPGDEIVFGVRTFGTTTGDEIWDFGDGTPKIAVRSDGNVEPLNPTGYAMIRHAYEMPGDYLVKVQRTDHHGTTATARLWIHVGKSG